MIRSHQLKVSMDPELYQRILAAMERGYYAGRYPLYFLAYLLWLGINKYDPKEAESTVIQEPSDSVMDVKINIEDSLYERGVSLRAGGPYKGRYKGLFWSCALQLGLECYEREILPREL